MCPSTPTPSRTRSRRGTPPRRSVQISASAFAVVGRRRFRVLRLAAHAEDVVRGERDLREQRVVGHPEVRLRVERRHHALVAEEHPRLVPRHRIHEGGERQPRVGLRGRGATRERDGEPAARGDRRLRRLEDRRRRGFSERGGIAHANEPGREAHVSIIPSRPARVAVQAPRDSARAGRDPARSSPRAGAARARSGRAPPATGAPAGPRRVWWPRCPATSDSGWPSASAMMRRHAGECASPPPEATITWFASAAGASSAYTSASRSATASSAACSTCIGVASRVRPRDDRAAIATPARRPLAGEERQHREPVAIGRARGQRALDRRVVGQLQQIAAPRVHVAALGRGATDDGDRAVDAIAPEALHARARLRRDDAQRRRGADVQRDARAVGAIGADVARHAVADRGEPRHGAQARPPARPRAAQPAASFLTIDEREELFPGHAGDVERFRVPRAARLVEEAGARRHRHAGRRLAEQLGLEMLAERAPSRDARHLGRPLAREPAQARRPVRRVQMAPGARVVARARPARHAARRRRRRCACPPTSRSASRDGPRPRSRAGRARTW